jgi:putative FmdB family regulatory protein
MLLSVMPIYEYSCRKCGKTIEVIQKMSDPELKKHQGCGGGLTKLISASGFQFKGTGWYVTDYARKGSEGESSQSSESQQSENSAKAAETDKDKAKKSPPATATDAGKTSETKSSDKKPAKSSDKKS